MGGRRACAVFLRQWGQPHMDCRNYRGMDRLYTHKSIDGKEWFVPFG